MQLTRRVPQASLLGTLLFVIFVNGLPLQVSKCEAFGYLNDFQFVAANSKNMQYDLKQIERCCLNNKKTKKRKRYILPIKSQNQTKLGLNDKTLHFQSKQRDLGIAMAPSQTGNLMSKKVDQRYWKCSTSREETLHLFQNWEQNSMRTQDLWYQLLNMQLEPVLLTKVRQRRLTALKGKLPVGSQTTGNLIKRTGSENTIYFLSPFM